MKISELIKELQEIQEKNGDVEVFKYVDENDNGLELSENIWTDVHYSDDKGEYFINTLEKGCRCMSCWTTKKVEKPFIIVS